MSHEQLVGASESDFELDKRRYFINLAWQMRQGLAIHQQQGLWERVPVIEDVPQGETKRDWGNVSEHCLVEGARVGVFADTLGFTPDLRRDLILAAVLHDGGKKNEIQKLRANGTSWEAYAEAGEDYKKVLTEAGFSERVIRLATAVGHETLQEAEEIVAKAKIGPLSEEDQAWLAMHYADDYTRGSEWAEPAIYKDDVWVNDLSRRVQQNHDNAQPAKGDIPEGKYHGINRAGPDHGLGDLTYNVQERVGAAVQDCLATLVSNKVGQTVSPWALPEFIDDQLRQQIAAFA